MEARVLLCCGPSFFTLYSHSTLLPQPDEYITIVSGLPRSGTSMLMKMLAAGGLPPLTDGIREADADNPGGYYEFEKVKQLKRDTTWLNLAKGKVVKVVSQLLNQLPLHKPYKIVFALRKMDEILASQRAMLARRGQLSERISDAELAAAFGRHLVAVQQWLAEHPQMEVLYVNYSAVLRDPLATSHQIKTFLARPLDMRQMASVVNEGLYHQRIS